jgi:hypothetical protein
LKPFQANVRPWIQSPVLEKEGSREEERERKGKIFE